MASVYGIHKEDTASGARYRVDYRDGSGRRTKRRFKRARDAEAFKKQVEASTYTGVPIPRPVQVTFREWATEWFAQREALSKAGKKPRPSTLQSWRSDLKSLHDSFGDHKLHIITTEAIIRYVQHLQCTPIEAGLRNGGQLPSDKSIRNKVGLLSLILRSAKARRILMTNPALDVDWKELLGTDQRYHRRYREIPLTPEQLLHLLEVARHTYTPKGGDEPTGPYYPLFEMAVWTGLRLGELIGLRWGDVNLESQPAVLSVQRSSYRGEDGPPKSRAGVREVLLIDRMVQVLQYYRNQCFGDTPPRQWKEQIVFQTAKGTKVDPDNVRQRHFVPLVKRANLPHTRIHDLRECCATLLASVVHYRILHIILGHEHLDTTLQYYVKAERLSELLYTSNPAVTAIRQEFAERYRMAHARYEMAIAP